MTNNNTMYDDMSIQDLLDEGVVMPEDIWTNMVGETMIMPMSTVNALSEIDFNTDDLTEEQFDLLLIDTEGNA